MTNIFIANLDWEVTSADLKTTFSTFGTVTLAHVVYDSVTRKSKGFGYVEMEDVDAAVAAIEALHGMEVNGRKLDVKIASPKANRPEKKEVVVKPKTFKPKDKTGFKPRGNKPHKEGGFKPRGERKPGDPKPSGEYKPRSEFKPRESKD
jgi:RNA recognition motif-containing protein